MQRALNQSFRFQLQSSTERLTASEGARGSRQPKSQVAFLRPRNSDFTTAATTATRRAAAAVASARRALMVPPFPSLPSPSPLPLRFSERALDARSAATSSAPPPLPPPRYPRARGPMVSRGDPMVHCAAEHGRGRGRAGGRRSE